MLRCIVNGALFVGTVWAVQDEVRECSSPARLVLPSRILRTPQAELTELGIQAQHAVRAR